MPLRSAILNLNDPELLVASLPSPREDGYEIANDVENMTWDEDDDGVRTNEIIWIGGPPRGDANWRLYMRMESQNTPHVNILTGEDADERAIIEPFRNAYDRTRGMFALPFVAVQSGDNPAGDVEERYNQFIHTYANPYSDYFFVTLPEPMKDIVADLRDFEYRAPEPEDRLWSESEYDKLTNAVAKLVQFSHGYHAALSDVGSVPRWRESLWYAIAATYILNYLWDFSQDWNKDVDPEARRSFIRSMLKRKPVNQPYRVFGRTRSSENAEWWIDRFGVENVPLMRYSAFVQHWVYGFNGLADAYERFNVVGRAVVGDANRPLAEEGEGEQRRVRQRIGAARLRALKAMMQAAPGKTPESVI
jgi:hypothetical protein